MVVAADSTSWGRTAAVEAWGCSGVPGPDGEQWGALGGSSVSGHLPVCLRASAWQLLTLPGREEEK